MVYTTVFQQWLVVPSDSNKSRRVANIQTQVKNYYQRQVDSGKMKEWEDIARDADDKKSRGEDPTGAPDNALSRLRDAFRHRGMRREDIRHQALFPGEVTAEWIGDAHVGGAALDAAGGCAGRFDLGTSRYRFLFRVRSRIVFTSHPRSSAAWL